jgi:Xaa-Pro aminopeptidase
MLTRLDRLRAAMRERDLPALLITEPANRRYISGFTGSAGALLVAADAALIFSDSRYRIQVGQEAAAFTLHEITTEQTFPVLLAAAARELALERVGFEASHMTYAAHGELSAALAEAAALPPALVPVEGLVEGLRMVKDAEELAALRQAIAITDAALALVLPRLRPSHTERQAAWMLEVAMREAGAEALAFPIIVAAGQNSARPHARPGDQKLGQGRPIVIDMGARFGGYHADLTRTIMLGMLDPMFREVYTTVRKAQQAAIAGLRAGLSGHAADALAREVIAEAGYGEKFGHGLGHGVGLNIHEGPSLRRAAPGSEDKAHILRAGHVTSVEPGIYIEGWGGVRIEDLVLITEDGCEVLSAAPK